MSSHMKREADAASVSSSEVEEIEIPTQRSSNSNSQEEEEAVSEWGDDSDEEEEAQEEPRWAAAEATVGQSARSHTVSSGSEYEEDLFPHDDQNERSLRAFNSNAFSSLSGSSFHSTNSNVSRTSTHKSIEVTPAVWAKTWEERVKQFQLEHPEEAAHIDRQMKRREIVKIQDERSQRLHENKLFKNVDRLFKIVGSALCAWFCCIIVFVILMAVIFKPDKVVSPAPTPPPTSLGPNGEIIIAGILPPRLPFPTVAPNRDEAPSIAPLQEEDQAEGQ